MGKMTKDGEDDCACQQRGERVSKTDDERILVGVVSELVVRAVGSQGTEPHTQREERLGNCRIPNLKVIISDIN